MGEGVWVFGGLGGEVGRQHRHRCYFNLQYTIMTKGYFWRECQPMSFSILKTPSDFAYYLLTQRQWQPPFVYEQPIEQPAVGSEQAITPLADSPPIHYVRTVTAMYGYWQPWQSNIVGYKVLSCGWLPIVCASTLVEWVSAYTGVLL